LTAIRFLEEAADELKAAAKYYDAQSLVLAEILYEKFKG